MMPDTVCRNCGATSGMVVYLTEQECIGFACSRCGGPPKPVKLCTGCEEPLAECTGRYRACWDRAPAFEAGEGTPIPETRIGHVAGFQLRAPPPRVVVLADDNSEPV